MPQPNEPGKPTPRTPGTSEVRQGGSSPAGLLLLSAIPLVAGAFRLTELAGGAEIMPANDRFFASPLPVVMHIVSATVYAILGAFQFAAGFRRRRPGWHRVAGRLVVGCGLVVGAVGAVDDAVLSRARSTRCAAVRLAARVRVGHGQCRSSSASAAIRRGEIARHRAWMMRGYAIGLGAGTQALTLGSARCRRPAGRAQPRDC